MDFKAITSKIIGAAIAVHRELGPGLLESVYQTCLAIQLQEEGLHVRTEVPVSVMYCGRTITEHGFRVDILVEDQIVIELKSVEKVQPVYIKQLLTYLRLADKPLGLLINFNESLVKNGITRVANGVDI
ncbi:GxxExxY protein [Syntrophotalea acetylenica]|uniref:GxxExxY protein n=1 Tax=Syntrophotalea acetylenica TaxID=29542 RepID=A0A1L3GID0_SYNAC|nr:GxxExxY protein [Syntrophotalea acetylenica]APG25681.1 GxxExxY protein [Syntrophotalea acetylenica]APG43753.1 GxxExxY protein [Syntrophotalea acetylenica]